MSGGSQTSTSEIGTVIRALVALAEVDLLYADRYLELLDLPRRRGLPRVLIEDAVRQRNARVCAALALDPFEFTLACVPFDAYLRLAPRHGWGRQTLWTHFDGYQLARDLLGIVGGQPARDELVR